MELTLVLLNPDIPCLCKQCRSRSVGFWRSQLIWICTVCHSVFKFISTAWIKQSDWLKIENAHGILIYSAGQGLRCPNMVNVAAKNQITLSFNKSLFFFDALTHCILNRLSLTIYWKSQISILGTSSYETHIFLIWLNNMQTVETLIRHCILWHLGLHCLAITLLLISWLQWVNV